MVRLACFAICLLASAAASAHMPWIYVSPEAYPRLFFGEDISERNYHLPETIGEAEVTQTNIHAPAKPIEMELLEEDEYVGLEAEYPIEPRGCLRSTVTYGIYHGTKLTYYVQCYPSNKPGAWPTTPSDDQAMQALLKLEEDKLSVTVLWNGKPVADTGVSLNNEKSTDGQKATTDAEGVATFTLDENYDGWNGLSVMMSDDEDAGELDGEAHTSATHILTTSFQHDSKIEKNVSALPELPEAVASFGAVVSDGWLYVYSGHMGQAHDHSIDNLSNHFRRTKVNGSSEWEELPMGTPLQGLPLVAHGGKIYRVGGLSALNKAGKEEDIHSVDSAQCYDPATKTWTDLPSLPTGRSSHNAAVVGDTLYIVGGWQLSGDNDGQWQAGALSLDLTDKEATWQELAEPPFKRRALAAGFIDGKIVALCGMSDAADISKQVFLYDPASKEWSEGPEFPGKPFHSFGVSAWNVGGSLYASGMEGTLYQLSGDLSEWKKACDLKSKRFFHQLVPNGKGGLLLVAGVSPEEGHLVTTENIELSK